MTQNAKTALITHDDCLRHETPPGHPEQVARLTHVLHALESLPLQRVGAPMATDDQITALHPQSYIDALTAQLPTEGQAQIDGDTWMSAASMDAARRGVGAALLATDMVLGGQVQNAFCAIRPPGHHAETQTAMGFCLFGNAALAAQHALDHHGLSRVAIVDFDVHHGNGTQDLMWNEGRCLTITSQQMPLWPGTGEASETGAAQNVLNIPLPPASDGATMRAAYDAQVWPRLDAFAPQLIIISAGFDAHKDDPLAQLEWDTDDYIWLTQNLCDLAAKHAGGKIVSTLEGGYDLNALARATHAHVKTLMEATK